MQKWVPLLSAIFFCFSSSAQKINTDLKRELDSIYQEDQHYRKLLTPEFLQVKADSVAAFYKIPKDKLMEQVLKMMTAGDSSNILRIDQVIAQYGYPGKSLVGTPTNEAAFYVIQHSQSIDKYIPIIKKAADKKQLSFLLYAMMLDRSLMYNDKEQIYGTQGKGLNVINSATGKPEFKMVIWPVKDPQNVNKRRKKAGFNETVEENAKRLGIEYTILTIEDIKNMQVK